MRLTCAVVPTSYIIGIAWIFFRDIICLFFLLIGYMCGMGLECMASPSTLLLQGKGAIWAKVHWLQRNSFYHKQSYFFSLSEKKVLEAIPNHQKWCQCIQEWHQNTYWPLAEKLKDAFNIMIEVPENFEIIKRLVNIYPTIISISNIAIFY